MIKKFGLIAAAAVLCMAAPLYTAAPASAQIAVQLGGGGYHQGYGPGYRGPGYGRSRAEFRRDRGFYRGGYHRRGRAIVIGR